MQVRVCIEIGDQNLADLATMFRVDHTETVAPSIAEQDDYAAVFALAKATLDRVQSDGMARVAEQMQQWMQTMEAMD